MNQKPSSKPGAVQGLERTTVLLDDTPPEDARRDPLEDFGQSARRWLRRRRVEFDVLRRRQAALEPVMSDPIRDIGVCAAAVMGRRLDLACQIAGAVFVEPLGEALDVWGPELVVLPGGAYLMGSGPDDKEAGSNERPQHLVTLAGFALGRYPVTFKEYDAYSAYCASTGQRQPDDRGWGRGRRPVINVSWSEASEFCAWLSARTGEAYRLSSESEWEYAARAGTTTSYPWGDVWDSTRANGAGEVGQTTPVDRYPANGWRLFDMNGNVWEWCQDTFVDDYGITPADGSPHFVKGNFRVLRGGSWDDGPRDLRSAVRNGNLPENRDDVVGFRVARSLP